jgi:hypothetical protein
MNKPHPVDPSNSTASNSVPLDWSPPVAEQPSGAGTAPPEVAKSAVTSFEATALSLTAPQRAAIIRLTSGATRCEAAAAAGVTRTTLYRWLNHDPAFQAAYNAWQKDLVTTAQGLLLAASGDAVATVLAAIRRGDAQLAWKLLQALGLAKPAKPGTTDLRTLQQQQELDRKRAEIAEKKEINQVLMDDISTIDPWSSPLT